MPGPHPLLRSTIARHAANDSTTAGRSNRRRGRHSAHGPELRIIVCIPPLRLDETLMGGLVLKIGDTKFRVHSYFFVRESRHWRERAMGSDSSGEDPDERS